MHKSIAKHNDVQSSLKVMLTNAIVKGASFLCRNTEPMGGWADFSTHRSGPSTSWLSAYVLIQAKEILPSQVTLTAIARLLAEKKPNGSWGFSQITPGDCDSTLHVIYVLRLYGINIKDYITSLSYVFRHCFEGGFRTYSEEDEINLYRGQSSVHGFKGWMTAHNCVSSVALDFFTRFSDEGAQGHSKQLTDYFYNRYSGKELWPAYWWRSNYFVASRVARSFLFSNDRRARLIANSVLETIASDWDHRGFWDNGIDKGLPCLVSTGLNTCTLMLETKYSDIIAATADWLVRNQWADGSWESKPILQIPPPDVEHPETYDGWRMEGVGVGSSSADKNRIYTTATVLGALSQLAHGSQANG